MTSIAELAARRTMSAAAQDFVALGLAKIRIKSAADRAAVLADPRVPDRVKAALELSIRAAIGAGSTTDPTFGAPLAQDDGMASGFAEGLSSISAFDRILQGGALRLPLKARVVSTTGVIQGEGVTEGQVRAVASLSLEGAALQPRKASGLVVVTDEIAAFSGSGALQFLHRELRRAVSRATNSVFLPAAAAAADTTVASTGFVLADIRALYAAVELGEDSRPLLIVHSDQAKEIATIPSDSGALVFPAMGPTGGRIGTLDVIASDEIASGEALMIDAASVVAESAAITLSTARHADLQMQTTPDSPNTAATVMQHLWQRGEQALLATRIYGFEFARTASIARLTGASYSSPDSPAN